MNCGFCKEDFFPRRDTKQFCSVICRAAARRKPVKTRKCDNCAVEFSPNPRYPKQKFCTEGCYQEFRSPRANYEDVRADRDAGLLLREIADRRGGSIYYIWSMLNG